MINGNKDKKMPQTQRANFKKKEYKKEESET
jgi:hypothetical protein